MVLSLLVLTPAACKKKEPAPAELIAAARPSLEPKIVAIERIAKTSLPGATGKISLAGPPLEVIGALREPPTGNAALVFDEDLKDGLTWTARVDLRRDQSSLANDCVMLVRKGTMSGIHNKMFEREPMIWDEAQPKRTLPACALVRYLLVVKLLDHRATKYVDKKSFVGGKAAAEALVFDLEQGGAYAGGVRFEAESSDFTKSDIDDDLTNNFEKAMQKAIHATLPNAKL